MVRGEIEELEDIKEINLILKAQPKGISKVLTYIILLLLISVILWSIIAQKESFVLAYGQVLSKDGDIEFYISGDDVGRISEGDNVFIEIRSFPASEYGYLNSKIEKISDDNFIKDGSNIEYYKSNCSVNIKELNTHENIKIRKGMLAEMRVIDKKQSYFNYMCEKIGISKL